MIPITQKEREALLLIFKDFTKYYNANSISKEIDISHVGVQKILKRFLDERLTNSRRIGKSIIHKPNFENDYTKQLISFLLADEANNFQRWKKEFKEVSGDVIMMHGSAIKNYKHANDIDVMVICDIKDFKKIDKEIKEIQEILPKKIHLIKLTKEDFLNNIKENKKAIIDIIKNAVILYGHDKYVEVMKNVSGF